MNCLLLLLCFIMAPPDPQPQVKPPKFDWESKNLYLEWKRFFEITDVLFATGTGPYESCKYKVTTMLLWMGGNALSRYAEMSTDMSEDDKKDYAKVAGKFEAVFKPQCNRVSARRDFTACTSKDSRNMEEFLHELRQLAKDCGYTNVDERLCEQFLFGCKNELIQKALLEEVKEADGISLYLTIARRVEGMQIAQASVMGKSVNAVQHGRPKQKKHSKGGGSQGARKFERSPSQGGKKCKYCDRSHKFGTEFCTAYGKTCHKCNGKNHYESVCQAGKTQPQRGGGRGGRGGYRGQGGSRGGQSQTGNASAVSSAQNPPHEEEYDEGQQMYASEYGRQGCSAVHSVTIPCTDIHSVFAEIFCDDEEDVDVPVQERLVTEEPIPVMETAIPIPEPETAVAVSSIQDADVQQVDAVTVTVPQESVQVEDQAFEKTFKLAYSGFLSELEPKEKTKPSPRQVKNSQKSATIKLAKKR
jgi:hypothetical protein